MGMMTTYATTITAHEIRKIAVRACVCERSVWRFLCGLPIRSTCRARIERALGIVSALPRPKDRGAGRRRGRPGDSAGPNTAGVS